MKLPLIIESSIYAVYFVLGFIICEMKKYTVSPCFVCELKLMNFGTMSLLLLYFFFKMFDLLKNYKDSTEFYTFT